MGADAGADPGSGMSPAHLAAQLSRRPAEALGALQELAGGDEQWAGCSPPTIPARPRRTM